jgi:DNA repair protein RecO
LFFKRRPQGQLVFITRAEPGDSVPPSIEDDLAKIALGSYMLELADALTSEEAEATDAYHILARALETLGGGTVTLALRQSFELNLLRVAGFGLDFARCRICGPDAYARGQRRRTRDRAVPSIDPRPQATFSSFS